MCNHAEGSHAGLASQERRPKFGRMMFPSGGESCVHGAMDGEMVAAYPRPDEAWIEVNVCYMIQRHAMLKYRADSSIVFR